MVLMLECAGTATTNPNEPLRVCGFCGLDHTETAPESRAACGARASGASGFKSYNHLVMRADSIVDKATLSLSFLFLSFSEEKLLVGICELCPCHALFLMSSLSFLCLPPECAQGQYGMDCQQSCECHNGGLCDRQTGHCFCQAGWTGAKCESCKCKIAFAYGPGPLDRSELFMLNKPQMPRRAFPRVRKD